MLQAISSRKCCSWLTPWNQNDPAFKTRSQPQLAAPAQTTDTDQTKSTKTTQTPNAKQPTPFLSLSYFIQQCSCLFFTEKPTLKKSYWENLSNQLMTMRKLDPHLMTSHIGKILDPKMAQFATELNNTVVELQNQYDASSVLLSTTPAQGTPQLLSFKIIGAGLAGLVLATHLRQQYPTRKITIHEQRSAELAAIRCQNLSFRLDRADQVCERVFKGTGLLGTEDSPGKFEQNGAWIQPAHAGMEKRLRAPILTFQDTLVKHLKDHGVQISYNDPIDINTINNSDPNTLTFVCTGIKDGLQKISPHQSDDIFELPGCSAHVMHLWEFKKSDTPIKTGAGLKEPYIVTYGGNKTEKLNPVFDGLQLMAEKGLVHLPTNMSLDELPGYIRSLKKAPHAHVNVYATYVKSDKDVQESGEGENNFWSAFKITPSFGNDPSLLSQTGPVTGNVLMCGDIINSRHPFRGNGALSIFNAVLELKSYIDRYDELRKSDEATNNLQQLSQDILKYQHCQRNIPQLFDVMIENLIAERAPSLSDRVKKHT